MCYVCDLPMHCCLGGGGGSYQREIASTTEPSLLDSSCMICRAHLRHLFGLVRSECSAITELVQHSYMGHYDIRSFTF